MLVKMRTTNRGNRTLVPIKEVKPGWAYIPEGTKVLCVKLRDGRAVILLWSFGDERWELAKESAKGDRMCHVMGQVTEMRVEARP